VTRHIRRAKPRLTCLGCGCTDDRACAGGCHWVQPGICSTCEPRTASILNGSPLANELIAAGLRPARRRLRYFPVMSLALVAWYRSEQAIKQHEDHLREGRQLKPFTRVRIGKTCISFSLVYAPPKGVEGLRWTESWRLSFGGKRP
jgi:hypothetical protein